jgi:glycosyltransferase involved in cell wall biosynthesis
MRQAQETPLISIVTVCRNSADTISRAFDSVLQQEYRHVDYVVVDGASSDRTLDVVKEYEAKFLSSGFQFRWISEPDKGIYDAMNKGIAMAQGDIINTLNSDDFYEPDTLRIMAAACSAHPEVGIFYGLLRVLMQGQELLIYRYKYEHYLLNLRSGVYSAAQHPTCFVRTDVYRQIGAFDPQFSITADHDFLIRAMQAGIKFYSLDAILCNFSSGGASDNMSDYERHRQRYAVWHKNGLLSESE